MDGRKCSKCSTRKSARGMIGMLHQRITNGRDGVYETAAGVRERARECSVLHWLSRGKRSVLELFRDVVVSTKGEIDRIEFRAAFGLLTKVLFGRFDGEAPGFESVVRRIRCRHDEPFPCSPVSAVRQCLRGRKRLYVRQQLLQRWAWPFPRTRTRPVSRWASDYRRERRMATENRKAPKGKRQETNKIQPEKLKWHTRTIICVYPLGFVCLLFL